MSELKSCPFCKDGVTQIHPIAIWTGIRHSIVSYELRHWCNSNTPLKSMINIKAKTEAECYEIWNGAETTSTTDLRADVRIDGED